MITAHQAIQELINLGLTHNQASIYLCLLEHGELRIRDVVKHTQIPRSSIYENLKGLFELGLIEELNEGSYKRIRAYPLSSMRHILEDRIGKLVQRTARLEDVEKILAEIPLQKSSPSTRVRYYKDVPGARQILWNTLKARDTVHVYSEWGRSSYVGTRFYENFVSTSRDRAIKEKVLINPSAPVLHSILADLNSPTSRTKLESIRSIGENAVFIRGETFIYDTTYAQVYLKNDEINGFEIEGVEFTATQISIFKTLWNAAEPLTKYLPD